MTTARRHRLGRFALLGAAAAVAIVALWWFWPEHEPASPRMADTPMKGP